MRLLVVTILIVSVLPFVGAGRPASGSSAALKPHPRIFLTPATLKSLRKRAKARSAQWKALKAQCNESLKGNVQWPKGKDYPSAGIGEGYQGSGYFAAIANLGLCYQVALKVEKKKAAKYGARGVDVLTKMSAPKGQHGEDPIRDSGYGVRFYGAGMALGFDWFFPKLTKSLKQRIDASLVSWLGTYERDGFENGFPVGNYYAGYYGAKGLAGIGTEGNTAHGAAMWTEWLTGVHRGFVQPYYAANLSGGGWPEGWNYGPLATQNMSWPVLAAKTGKGLDLVHAGGAPYLFPLASPEYVLYFTWPNLLSMEDNASVYDGDNPTATRPSFYASEAGLLEALKDPFAPTFHSFAQAVRAAQPSEESASDNLWETFLFWNPSAPSKSYTTLPRSYLARGIEKGAVRSSWEKDAVWAAFNGGPFIDYPDAGREYFDKGSLAIVRGGRHLLVNATGALMRNTPGTSDGSQYFQLIYDDLFGSPPDGNHTLFNVFYADPEPLGQGSGLRSLGARTTMSRFEDGGSYVAMRASHLEDQYPQNPDSEEQSITSWTRQVIYVRPEIFVVYDRTSVSDASTSQWFNYYLGHASAAGTSPGAGVNRFDVGSGSSYAGSVQTVYPSGHTAELSAVFDHHKIDRMTIRPGSASANNRWLTVFDAASSPGAVADAVPLDPDIGDMTGVLLKTGTGNSVVLAGGSETVSGEVMYTVPAAQTRHVVTDLASNTSYSVTGSLSGGNVVIDLEPGSGFTTSGTGVLSFQTSASGAVSASTR